MEIEVIIPGEISSAVLSQTEILQSAQTLGVKITPISNSKNRPILSHNDFGATAVAVLGTAAAGAAVKGLFDLFKTIIIETQKTKRQNLTQEYELQILKLRIDNKIHKFDLNKSIPEIENQLEQISKRP